MCIRDRTGATKKNVDKLYTLLNEQGISAGRYHAGLSNDERKQNQEDFTCLLYTSGR